MKLVYSLPHPSDQLGFERAGHIIRANALLNALERQGHEVIRVQASASVSASDVAVNTYRGMVKRLIPRPIALCLRDAGRMMYTRLFANRLTAAVEAARPDFILETNIAFSSAGAIASRRTGVPLVIDDTAPPLEEDTEVGYGIGLKGMAVRVFRRITRQAAVVVAVSGQIRRHLLDEGVPDEKVVIIPNGIDSTCFHAGVDGCPLRASLGIPPDAIVLVFVGSFQPFHRVDLLLRSFANLKAVQPLHLLLVGEGRTTPDAKAQAQQLGIADRVTFAGRVPYAEVANYLAAGDIAVLPGVLDFGNSMKLFEYMALGKAVVAPNLDVITDTATHGEDVFLFQDGNGEELRKALSTLVQNRALRERLGKTASERAMQHTWDARASKLIDTLHERRVVANTGR
jgi:glycosyltransferase involved in cell wall biosynthesis